MARPMKRSFIQLTTALLALGAPASPAMSQSITLKSNIAIPDGGEILSFSPDGNTVASNVAGDAGFGTQLYTLGAGGTLAPREFVSVAGEFGGAVLSVSSVALDPLARGFGAMTVIPDANRTTAGVVVLFDYRSGTAVALKTLEVGFHPDSLLFSRDGSKIFVANEGEYTGNGNNEGGGGGDTDAPGSVSIIDLSGVAAIGDVAGLDNGDVTTVDFSPANLGPGIDLDDLRFNDDSFTPGNAHRHVEPEYLTEGDGKVYVTLQENNAIAELSLSGPQANKITAIFPLGTIEQTIDASDEDGPGDGTAAEIDDLVKGMPMPDTVTSFVSGGVRYLVTANEGDFRPDDGDRARVKDFDGNEDGVAIDDSDAVLGRLRILTDVSDPDGDDLLDDAVMPGTRSFSVWNANTGALVADTGSFEPLLLGLFPTRHNIDGESGTDTFDDRSDDKGPEPEAIATGVINGHRYVFVAMERQGAILMYNLDNPANPIFVASINNVTDGLVAPESITFIPAADSPLAQATLLVGYEVGGRIGVYSLVGQPATPPTLTVRRTFFTGKNSKTAVIKGKASADTARVLVGGKQARGTRNWSAKVRLAPTRKVHRFLVTALSQEGARASKPVFVKRRNR